MPSPMILYVKGFMDNMAGKGKISLTKAEKIICSILLTRIRNTLRALQELLQLSHLLRHGLSG